MIKRTSLKFIKFILIFSLVIITAFIGVGCGVYEKVTEDMSIDQKINEIKSRGNYVQASEIDKTFLDAIVAIEDHRYYKHGAVDFISIGRALLTNLKAGEIVEGGSTITQQLAKNLFLTSDQTIKRKIEEVFLAYDLEKKYTKDEILELYVNVIYYGDGFTGIKEACNGYFGKEPNEITYDEATLLAGLPQAPSIYGLSDNYEKAIDRQEEVISALENFAISN